VEEVRVPFGTSHVQKRSLSGIAMPITRWGLLLMKMKGDE
jgi:hypothetical protein